MRDFGLLVALIALFLNGMLSEKWESKEVEMRCWENTSVTHPIAIGQTLQMFCDPCEIQNPGVEWLKDHGTWDKSILKDVEFKFEGEFEQTVGRLMLNWDMSFSIHDVKPEDEGRYRCSRKDEVYSWHQVIVHDPSKCSIIDRRKPISFELPNIISRMQVYSQWGEWSRCTECDGNKMGKAERIGYCYLKGKSPLAQYHNGLPCNFPSDEYIVWKKLREMGADLRDQKVIAFCQVTCREADKKERFKEVAPYVNIDKCLLEFWHHRNKYVPVYEGETLRLVCHPCERIYGGVKWLQGSLSDGLNMPPVKFDWHDNDDENKFILDYNMAMEIRRVTHADAKLYMCKRRKEILAANQVVVKERPKEIHLVDTTKNQEPYEKRGYVYTFWTQWGPCSKCGESGTRVRMGFCFSKHLYVIGHEALFQYRLGVPCFTRLDTGYQWSSIKEPMLDEKMIETCNLPCIKVEELNIFSSEVQQVVPRGPGNPWVRLHNKDDEDKVNIKIREYKGKDVHLVCPGSTEYDVTQWENGTQPILLSSYDYDDQADSHTGLRVYVDDFDGSLHIKNITEWDEQEYHCFVGGEEAAAIRLVVLNPLLELKHFYDSFFHLGSVLLFYSIIFVFVLFMKCLARYAQNKHFIKRTMQPETPP